MQRENLEENQFRLVGIRPSPQSPPRQKRKRFQGKPIAAACFLGLIAAGCLLCLFVPTRDPSYLDLGHCGEPPGREFLFGTDAMGRDIFAMIWHGGRVSLLIGAGAAAVSAGIGVLFGAASGWGPSWLDRLLMRFLEIFLCVPELLLVLFLQAILGEATVWSIALVIGATSWAGIGKVVRAQVRQLRQSESILAARAMGGGFFYLLRKHLIPEFAPSIFFMVVMNIRGAIMAEATLSFLGLGLPLEVISWGTMLSLAEKAFLTSSWWAVLIPGGFLVVTLLCVTSLGEYFSKRG